jgi:hypothetical protein
LSSLSPYLREALEIAEEEGFKLALYDIPLCIINLENWNSIRFPLWQTRADEEEVYKSPEICAKRTSSNQYGRAQPTRCVGCKAKTICPGVWKSYIETFGEFELKPIS